MGRYGSFPTGITSNRKTSHLPRKRRQSSCLSFIDPKKKRVRCLRKNETDYDETFITTGRLTLSCIPGFWIEVAWLFADEKPVEFTVTKQLIEAAEAGDK